MYLEVHVNKTLHQNRIEEETQVKIRRIYMKKQKRGRGGEFDPDDIAQHMTGRLGCSRPQSNDWKRQIVYVYQVLQTTTFTINYLWRGEFEFKFEWFAPFGYWYWRGKLDVVVEWIESLNVIIKGALALSELVSNENGSRHPENAFLLKRRPSDPIQSKRERQLGFFEFPHSLFPSIAEDEEDESSLKASEPRRCLAISSWQ